MGCLIFCEIEIDYYGEFDIFDLSNVYDIFMVIIEFGRRN